MKHKECAACAARDETIQVLREQVEWLRTQAGTPTIAHTLSPWNDETLPIIEGQPPYLTDEQEETYELARNGRLPQDIAEEFLTSIGAINTKVTIE